MEIILRNFNELGFAAIDGHIMRDTLKGFGATEEDLEKYPNLWNSVGQDPTYSFRKSSQTRWVHQQDFQKIHRLVAAPFKLNKKEDAAEQDNPVLGNKPRQFAEGSDEFIESSVHHACVRFIRYFLREKRKSERKPLDTQGGLGYISGSHQFRITKRTEVEKGDEPPSKRQKGESIKIQEDCPTPEGVHRDGASVVMVMYINSNNLAPRAGESRVYSNGQPGGVMDREESCLARKETRLAERNLVTPFETMLLNDEKVKHDNKPIVLKDPTQPAFRDVHVIWAREFLDEYGDTTAPNGPHKTLPVEMTDFPEDADLDQMDRTPSFTTST